MPDEVRGALVFRLGFPEGVGWSKDSNTVDSIIKRSRKVNDARNEMATVKEVEVLTFSAEKIPEPLERYQYDTAT